MGALDWRVAVVWEKIAVGWYQLIRPLCLLDHSLLRTHRKFCSHTSQHNQLISGVCYFNVVYSYVTASKGGVRESGGRKEEGKVLTSRSQRIFNSPYQSHLHNYRTKN